MRHEHMFVFSLLEQPPVAKGFKANFLHILVDELKMMLKKITDLKIFKCWLKNIHPSDTCCDNIHVYTIYYIIYSVSIS